MTIDLAGAYGRDNVRVNAVLPGIIATPMQASVGTVADDVRARLNLLGRMGDAWDIANAVLFLCSDEGGVHHRRRAARRRRRHRRDARVRPPRRSVASDACTAGICTETRRARRTSRPSSCPLRESYAGTVRALTDIPVTTMGMGQFIGRKPDVGVHNAPRRQFLVVLEGELEIVTTLGRSERLRPGDVLLADDGGSKGHISRDVGDDAVDADGRRDRPGLGARAMSASPFVSSTVA